MAPLTSERKAQLEEYAQRHGHEALAGSRSGYENFKAGRMRPFQEVFEELLA